MDFTIPLLILVVVAAVVALAARALRRAVARSSGSPDSGGTPDSQEVSNHTGPEMMALARSSAEKLDQDQHRRVYALIAQNQQVGAIKFFHEVTGEGLRASRDAVGALSSHPQPFRAAAPVPTEHDTSDQITEEATPERFSYRYRAIASRGDVTREVSSNMLNDAIFADIRKKAAGGNIEDAAIILKRHSEISLEQAREFIALLEP